MSGMPGDRGRRDRLYGVLVLQFREADGGIDDSRVASASDCSSRLPGGGREVQCLGDRDAGGLLGNLGLQCVLSLPETGSPEVWGLEEDGGCERQVVRNEGCWQTGCATTTGTRVNVEYGKSGSVLDGISGNVMGCESFFILSLHGTSDSGYDVDVVRRRQMTMSLNSLFSVNCYSLLNSGAGRGLL